MFRLHRRLAGPISILFGGCQGSSQGLKHPGPEADLLPPSSPKVDTDWSDTPALPPCLSVLFVSTQTTLRLFNGVNLGILYKEVQEGKC